MEQYKYITTHFLLLILITLGCGKTSETSGNKESESDQLIIVTQEQVDSENIEQGGITNHVFEESVICNGYIIAPANGMAQISTPISGIVETINCSLGNYVKKGAVLCLLTSNEFMVVQQDFAVTSVNLKRLKADYERNKTLYDEKIGSEKDFLVVESEYKAMTAKYDALKIRLELLRLDVSKIIDGKLFSSFPVIAPIAGYITNMDMVLGQYIEQQQSLIEIIDINRLQLQLSLFEDDIAKLKTGQKVKFNTLGESALIHSATLISVGKTINQESGTIKCIAKIDNEDNVNFINHAYVEASVVVNKNEAKALPNEAILKSEKDYYVFVVEKIEDEVYYLKRLKVNIGRVSNDYSEIVGVELPDKVLIKGVYNLQSE